MHRGWQDDPVFDDEPYTQREAWEWLISKASYDGTQKFNIKGFVCCLPVGQLSYSFSYMAKAWGWSKAKVKRYVDRIDDANMVETMTERGQIVITICKYEKFQLKEKKSETITDEIRNDERNASETKYKEKEVNEGKEVNKYIGEFEAFWKMFPKQRAGNKEKAHAAYKKAITRDDEQKILNGCKAYAKSDEVAKGYAKGAAAWLNDDRWNDNHSITPDTKTKHSGFENQDWHKGKEGFSDEPSF